MNTKKTYVDVVVVVGVVEVVVVVVVVGVVLVVELVVEVVDLGGVLQVRRRHVRCKTDEKLTSMLLFLLLLAVSM